MQKIKGKRVTLSFLIISEKFSVFTETTQFNNKILSITVKEFKMALLRVANLRKSYNITKTHKQEVLKGVDIEFKSGDLVALLGESGCGKSTFINILGGLDTDYSGSVIIKGAFIRDFTEKQMDDYRKKRVGLIFQNYNLISHMTLLENVEIAMAVSDIDPKVRSERAMDLLKMVGLGSCAKKMPNQLSGGQKQRVAIARALANNPTIILADEPTGALDKNSADLVLKILRKIAESGKLVIIVTHSQKVASECGRIIRMEDGRIVEDRVENKIHTDSRRDKEVKPKSIKNRDVAQLAYRNIKQTKGRSLLVSLGMSIGIAAVVLILCLSSGITSYVNNVYAQNLASLQMTVYKNSDTKFTTAEITSVSSLDGISSLIESYLIADSAYSYGSGTGTVNNLTACYDDFSPSMLYGDLPSSSGEIIINETLANEILDSTSLISVVGNSFTVTYSGTSRTYTISGIYEDTSNATTENNAYVTGSGLTSLYSYAGTYVNRLYITAGSVTYVSGLVSDLEALGFNVYQVDNSAETVLEYIDMGTGVLMGVTAISMVVSAIMIFIVLYISVAERTKEIGILRAIGARKSDIKRMFIFEAGILGLMAGIFGVAVCFGISLIVNVICSITLESTLISYNILYYLLGILASVGISILAGIAPAMRAADLDPVESLRSE